MPRLIGLVYLPSYTLLSVLEFSYAKATVKLVKYLCGGGARPYFRVCPDLAGTRSGAGVTWVSDIPGRLDSSFGKRGPQRPPEPANHSPKRQTPAETVVTEDQCASTRRISTGCSSAYIHPWADAPGLRPHGKCQKFLLHWRRGWDPLKLYF